MRSGRGFELPAHEEAVPVGEEGGVHARILCGLGGDGADVRCCCRDRRADREELAGYRDTKVAGLGVARDEGERAYRFHNPW